MASSIPGFGWTCNSGGRFRVGQSLAVPLGVHRAAREKVCALMHNKYGVREGVALIEGGNESCAYDTDTELLFKQDSWFNYLFGAKEPGFFGLLHIDSGKSTLFVPRLGPEYEIWCGKILPASHFQQLYDVDEVLFADDLFPYLERLSLNGDRRCLHLLEGINSDSGTLRQPAAAVLSGVRAETVCTSKLFHCMSTARVTKSADEQTAMRYCAYVASNAHVEVMRKAAQCSFEFELEALFLYEIYRNGGCRRAAYTSICACGPNSAVLHYGHASAPNDRRLLPGDMCLLDMGAEYHGYVSDITCSFPRSGAFSADQRIIYSGVLEAQRAVFDMMRPGVSWPACHKAAEAKIIEALTLAGVLVGGSSAELSQVPGLGAVFFPHGLGHLIGCDTHDVGGYIEGTPSRHAGAGVQKLRTARVLEEGMVLTNEPGCYFVDILLDAALADASLSQYIDAAALQRFRGFGGMRLEDVVLVTRDGCDNLTQCPRTVEEVEGVVGGAMQWPPEVDSAPWLRRRWSRLAPGGEGMQEIAVPAIAVAIAIPCTETLSEKEITPTFF